MQPIYFDIKDFNLLLVLLLWMSFLSEYLIPEYFLVRRNITDIFMFPTTVDLSMKVHLSYSIELEMFMKLKYKL